jgi:hypothetical protein
VYASTDPALGSPAYSPIIKPTSFPHRHLSYRQVWIMEVNWVSIYQAALIELEQAKISGRITEAQKAIIGSIEILGSMPNLQPEEKNALEHALRSLRGLDQNEPEVLRCAVAKNPG